MCYIIAKHGALDGCVALKTAHGEDLVNLKRRIESQIGYTEIELITLSRPSAYPEYEPYRFVDTETEFEEATIQLAHSFYSPTQGGRNDV